MTDTSTLPAPVAPRPPGGIRPSTAARPRARILRSGPPGLAVVAAVVGLAGFGIRLTVLLGHGGLLGSSAYDDGVYYAASAAFVHGRWPYADFLLLQPPGVVLAGTPFALLGSILGDPAGVIAARLVWIGMGAANCALVAVLAGRRSRAAALVAGGFAACSFPLAYSERSMLLEPLATLLLLLALGIGLRGTRRAALAAGVLVGLTVDVKIWYVVPALVLFGFARHRSRFALGAIASAALVAAPFLVRAPESMVRQVLLDQLGRPRLPDDTFANRLPALTGARYVFGSADPSAPATLVVAAVAGTLVVLSAVAAWRTAVGRRAVVLLAATTVVLLVSPSFFTHYIAFAGCWAAVVLGLGAGALLARLRRPAPRIGVAVLLTVLATVPTLGADLARAPEAPPAAPIAAAAQRFGGCIRSDDPGLLAALNVLSRDLDRGCALWPDLTGWTYDRPGFPTVAGDRPDSALWQRFATDYLLGGDAVITTRTGTGLSARTAQSIGALPELARSGSLVLHGVPR